MTVVTTASIVVLTFVDIYRKFTILRQATKLLRTLQEYKCGLHLYNGYINTALTQAFMLICPQKVANIARTGIERNHVCTDLSTPRSGFFAFINIYITSREEADSGRDVFDKHKKTNKPRSFIICTNYSTPDLAFI